MLSENSSILGSVALPKTPLRDGVDTTIPRKQDPEVDEMIHKAFMVKGLRRRVNERQAGTATFALAFTRCQTGFGGHESDTLIHSNARSAVFRKYFEQLVTLHPGLAADA